MKEQKEKLIFAIDKDSFVLLMSALSYQCDRLCENGNSKCACSIALHNELLQSPHVNGKRVVTFNDQNECRWICDTLYLLYLKNKNDHFDLAKRYADTYKKLYNAILC